MSIENWTSEGMDWAVDRVDHPPQWQYAEALRLAIIERANAAGASIATSLLPVIGAGSLLRIGAAAGAVSNYRSDFDLLMSTLIPLYVNHTNLDGDWTGQSAQTPGPMWTEADILTAIGAGSRLWQKGSPPTPWHTEEPHKPISWEWMKQQYDLLNMLRWTKKSPTYVSVEYRNQNFTSCGYYSEPCQKTDDWATAKYWAFLADAQASYRAPYANWYLYDNYAKSHVDSYGIERNRGGDHAMVMDANRYRHRHQMEVSGIYSGLAHKAQFYMRPREVAQPDPPSGTYVYHEPEGHDAELWFIHEEQGPVPAERHVTGWFGKDPRLHQFDLSWCDEPVKPGTTLRPIFAAARAVFLISSAARSCTPSSLPSP